MVVVNVGSGISGESNEGASGGMVDGSESKTLAENSSDKGVLSEGVRVSENSNTENVINARGKESVESGRLKLNDKRDISKSQMRSRSNRWDSWESWGVMNMVGRVLGGKFSMDEDDDVEDVNTSNNGWEANVVEVEDVNTSKNGREVNVVTDTNEWQGVIGELICVDKSGVERIVVEKDSDELISDYLVEGTGFNVDRDSDELILDDLIEGTGLKVDQDSDELILDDLVEGTGLKVDQDSDELILDDLVEGSGLKVDQDSDELILDDLVEGTGLKVDQDSLSNELTPDGMLKTDEVNDVEVDTFFIPKTRGEHQITEKEGEYYLSDLVWGKVKSHPWWPGQIFPPIAASNKAAKHIRKQSYLIAYFGDQTFAWNEESQLKPFRMHFSQMEKQGNSDGFSHAVSCALDEVTRRVEFGLSCPCLSEEVHDKIKIQVVSNAGIWEDKNIVDGGDNLSSAASFLPGNLVQFLESVAECPQSKTDRLQFTIAKAQLLAFNRWKGHYKLPVFEEFVGLLEDDTQVTVKEEGLFHYDSSSKKRKSTARDGSSQKRRHPSGDKEFPMRKEKCISALMSSSTSTLPNVDEKPMKRAGRRPISSGQTNEGTNSIASNSKAKRRKSLLPTSPIGEKSCEATLKSVEESELVEIILSEIPTPDVICSKLILAAKVPMQGFNIMVSELDFLREFRNLVCLEKRSNSGNAEMDAGKHKGKQPANLETANTFGLEGTKDSYWTDKIIQSYSQDQMLFEPKNSNDKAVQVGEADIRESDTVVVNLGLEKPSDEYQPTALILNFTNLDYIPSVTNLNEIFNRYGPLNESETEILRKSKRAKVIFKRRADAETAFSSTGKYSIFGPSLISYKLHYAPTPRKSRGASKRSKRDTSPKVDA